MRWEMLVNSPKLSCKIVTYQVECTYSGQGMGLGGTDLRKHVLGGPLSASLIIGETYYQGGSFPGSSANQCVL